MTENLKSLGAVLRQSCIDYAGQTAIYAPQGSGGHQEVTYKELWELIRVRASGLVSLGLKKGSVICIFSENSLEWALLDFACQTLGVIAVPIYPTLPADQAQYIAKDCEASFAFCGTQSLADKLKDIEPLDIYLLENGDKCFAEVAKRAKVLENDHWNGLIDDISANDTATIIYTSGTTGLPKGAVLPHRNFVWMANAVSEGFDIGPGDLFLNFLPLSHVFARANDHFLPVSIGASIGYVKNLSSMAADMASLRPTIMLVVPRFLEAMKDRISAAAAKEKGLKKFLFDSCLEQGRRKSRGEFAPFAGLLDGIVGKKIRARTGGRLRFFVSGGAAMPLGLYEFYSAFGLNVLQGYGLTETTSGIYLNNPARAIRPDTVGEPLPGVETKIAEDGEILVRGQAIMTEYFHLTEETAKAIDSEGWFHTGDVGEIDGGYLRITDRKKDLIVLSNGKNVAPQKLENSLRSSDMIAEAVVLGDSLEGCIGLIVPNFDAIRAKLSVKDADADLCQRDDVKALIKAEVDAFNRKAAPFEAVKRHALLPTAFTIEGGELTPTLKVKRRVIKEKYADIIRELSR